MPVTNVSLTAPTDYQVEAASIERRRKLAEALQSQSLEPIQTNQMAGGWVVPVSPWQGAAKMAQALMGGYGQKQADERQKALAAQLRGERSDTVSKATEAFQGHPESWQGEGMDELHTPAQSPNRQAGYQILAQSSDPSLQQLGLSMLMKEPESPWAKVDPSKFTPESVQAFSRTVGMGQTPNPSLLVPRPEFRALQNVAGPNGPVTQFYDPQNPPRDPVQMAVKPESVTTAGSTGAPQTSFVNPYAQNQPLPQPVRMDMVNTGQQNVPVNPYTQAAPLQNTVSPNTVATNAVTARGQDLTNMRQGQQNTIQLTEGIRKEFNALPEVQNYKQVLPIIESVKRAPDTPAGDIDLIYGVGKVMDPNSVVREGELTLVIKSGSPAQRLQGFANYVRGGGRLTQDQRKQLVEIMDSRTNALKANYDAARNSYTNIVKQQGLEPSQVFPELHAPGAANVFDQADAILNGNR